MIYSAKNPLTATIIDNFKTGNYGADNDAAQITCRLCGGGIYKKEMYYCVADTAVCMMCKAKAEEMILQRVSSEFIYEL